MVASFEACEKPGERVEKAGIATAHWAKRGGHVDLHTFGSKKLQKL